jgi:hypothetical protein
LGFGGSEVFCFSDVGSSDCRIRSRILAITALSPSWETGEALVNWSTMASFFVILRLRPFSVTVIRSQPYFSRIVARFFEPFGRPFGFPDLPLTKRECFGGLPNPTSWFPPVSATAILRASTVIETLARGERGWRGRLYASASAESSHFLWHGIT